MVIDDPEVRGARRPRLEDVARECGVAISTVSRAFSRPQRVNALTRERVLAAAARIGYRPPRETAARTLAVVVSDIANPFYGAIIKGAQARAAAAGFFVALADTNESAQDEAKLLRALIRNSTACLLATSRLSDAAIARVVDFCPFVMLNRRMRGVSSVVADTASGMRALTRHLGSLGHRQIAYLSGPRASATNSERWVAVRDESRSQGIRAQLLGPFAPTTEGGAEAAERAVRSGASAVIAYNDLLALGAMRRLQELGLAVPEDISVAGCDDTFVAAHCSPQLTTISVPKERLGDEGVQLLLQHLDGAEPVETVLDTHLALRASTGPPRAPRWADGKF